MYVIFILNNIKNMIN